MRVTRSLTSVVHPLRFRLALVPALFVLSSLPTSLTGQVTATDYARAEQFLGWHARNLVSGDQVNPTWLEDGGFWYRSHLGAGNEFVIVDPGARTRRPAFDHVRLAGALSEARDTSYEALKLPFTTFDFENEGRSIRFQLSDSIQWSCDIVHYRCMGPDSAASPPVTERPSPDGRWIAFERDENLWLRSDESGQERQLTRDGEEDYGYAVVPEGCCGVVTRRRRGTETPPVVIWSEDSRKLATHRFDERGVRTMHLIETSVKGPIIQPYINALPGDSVIPTYDIFVFDAESGSGLKADRGPQEMVNTTCCGLFSDTIWKDVHWADGSDEIFFTHGQRDFTRFDLLAMDTRTGATRTVVTETGPTFVELTLRTGGVPNWRLVNSNRELVWFSERDGWGHLYLYDATTGELKNRITSGAWLVADLLQVDEAGRWVYFIGMGREEGDPYYRHLYRARLDGSAIQRLTPEEADHNIRVSPSGEYFVDSYSTRLTEPVTVLRGPDGRVLMTVEEADFGPLLAAGWKWPTPFSVKARDGLTDLYGFLYFPTDFDPAKKYPVIDYIYPGPQTGPIGFRSANAGPRGNGHAMAELGFIVFTIDALGTPFRSKAFHDFYYGNMGDNGIPDHIAALRQLSRSYPQLDLDRVGIYGHSGGGFSSTDALLRYPDFFKVAVSSAGNHDNRSYDYTWGEKYQGVLERNDDGTDNFDSQANQKLAKNLEGKLLLMYGTLDDNVHPNATLLLVDELIEHNKDFDMLVMPNRNHGFAGEPYVIRRTWDYFVEHLLGVTPPENYEIRPPPGG
ncbi:MAG: DPP IV N-terminal domain-containing protein [Gemmatimonadetes bacterium]|nr:DPP IV N-terminal domain-containing protein [Gemmatimonadota bacterium]